MSNISNKLKKANKFFEGHRKGQIEKIVLLIMLDIVLAVAAILLIPPV